MIHQDAFIHESAYVEDGAEVGSGTKVWHFCHVMSKARIGSNCTLGKDVFVADDVEIGNRVKIQNNVSVYKGVICEDEVFLGPAMVFTNVVNPRSGVDRSGEYIETRVRRGASIGANATIICGNEIGEYAFVGAGAVVTKPVPAYALVLGNPARQSGWMSRNGHRLEFDEHGRATCPETGEEYRLEDGKVTFVG